MRKKDKIALYICIGMIGVSVVLGVIWGGYLERRSIPGTEIQNLTVCHLTNPMGLDESEPTFSWQLASERRGCTQEAYRILVAEDKSDLDRGKYIWDSGRVEGSISVGIPYEGETLLPMQRYCWEVEVWDEQGNCQTSEEYAWFETGLMGNGMSGAKWISAPKSEAKPDYGEDELKYTISYTMEVENTSAGFLFGAKEGRYGEMYLFQITNSGDQPYVKLKTMDENSFVGEIQQEITHCLPEDGKTFDVVLNVDHEKLSVCMNGTMLQDFQIKSTPVGSIGYYKSRGTSYAWIDDIFVQASDGTVLYEENFENEENIFSPYYVTVKKGRLMVGSGLMLTPGVEDPAPLFRKEFEVKSQQVKSARIYMTALGSFSLSVNGEAVSEDYLAPGKLAYNSELSYVTYDVTNLLKKGETNAWGITLLHGWYDRGVGYPEIWNPWGDTNALLGKMEIVYQNGSTQTIVTDEEFLCYTNGPVRENDLYQGEYYDANYEQEGFDTAGFIADDWMPVEVNAVREEYQTIPLVGKANEPITCVEELKPIDSFSPKKNVYVYDFGQNFAGTCRIEVKGKKGQVITLRYGEEINGINMINADDTPRTVWTENLLTAEATDYYVLRGDEEGEVFEPEFVFHGFRYLQISGLDEELPLTAVKGIVLSSDLEQTGSFTCSDELVNRYYENTIWSQKSNFMDNPMDCPQRDERHGWAGDAQIFSLTASYNMNTYAFYRKFLRDERNIQNEGGSFADMAPRNFGTQWDGSGGAASHNCWGDAPVVITWNLYTQYGDKSIIEENYEALVRWMEMLVNTSENNIRYWDGYGDHLSLESTPAELSDTAWCAHSADLLSRMAVVLGKTEDAEKYRQIYESFKQAWQEQFVMEDGITICNTQTSYALGLAFDLFPEDLKDQAAANLNALAEYSGHHILTGYSGIGYLLPALSSAGYTESAYQMLRQTESPSLLYGVTKGATTNWEQLQAYKEEEGGYSIDGSLNHYAYGTPVSWLYTDVLGIKSDENQPGYKHILVEPKAGGGLTYAEGSYSSTYGIIGVKWEKTENGYRYEIKIPANTTATLTLPVPDGGQYQETGEACWYCKDGVTLLENDGEKIRYELLAGTYSFEAK